MKKLGHILAHYVSGLFLACWKSGIHALKINGGLSLAAQANITPPFNLQMIVAVFCAAALIEAIEYFDANPLPDFADVIDPDEPLAPATIAATPKVSPS